ncbi:hypothetical protein [Antarcticirhabdus aurantiaca]|uniref:Uncharacterized protein n=1 Tax=Antarcticirhabdus aurantiaca TaxID=2606717 RepID=A0ACD4NH88_9HYPH|nr:hypothetical protein [Antarcticirhabdus aurantiaca]WAJ26160.1 hypothetical protein OXU80_14695 [Jeongeuplla avenae]
MGILASGRYRGQLDGGQTMILRCERNAAGGGLMRISGDVVEPDGAISSFVSDPPGTAGFPAEGADGFLRFSAETVSRTGANAFRVTLDLLPGEAGRVDVRLVHPFAALNGSLSFVDTLFRSLVLRVDVWPGVVPREPVDDSSEAGRQIVSALAAAGIAAAIETGVAPDPTATPRRIEFRDLHAWLRDLQPPPLGDGDFFVSMLLGSSLAGGTGKHTQGMMYETFGERARQGVAVFLDHAAFATPNDEVWRRELVFSVLHEIGHALNLPHAWLAEPPGPSALSWMTYPDRYPGGTDPFWTAFEPGCFGETELPYLRHAYHCDIAPGQSHFDERAWPSFVRGGGSDRTSGRRASAADLAIAPLKPHYALGEPIFLRAEIRNTGARRLSFVDALDPSDGWLDVAVTTPDGSRRSFVPPARLCQTPRRRRLEPDAHKAFDGILLSFSQDGPLFEEPGLYRVEARFEGLQAGPLLAATEIRILYPTREEELFARALFADAALCRAIWLRHPLSEKQAWADMMDKHAHLLPTDAGNTTSAYLHYVAAQGWLKPHRDSVDGRDCGTNRRKAKAHLQAVVPTHLPAGVGRLRALLVR